MLQFEHQSTIFDLAQLSTLLSYISNVLKDYLVGSSNNQRSLNAKIALGRKPIHEFFQLAQFILRNEMQHR